MAAVVIAPAVQVIVGGRAHFLEEGAVLPEGVDEATLERLRAEGLIADVESEPIEVVGEPISEEEAKAIDPAVVELADGSAPPTDESGVPILSETEPAKPARGSRSK